RFAVRLMRGQDLCQRALRTVVHTAELGRAKHASFGASARVIAHPVEAAADRLPPRPIRSSARTGYTRDVRLRRRMLKSHGRCGFDKRIPDTFGAEHVLMSQRR